jgi:hypothetical protein
LVPSKSSCIFITYIYWCQYSCQYCFSMASVIIFFQYAYCVCQYAVNFCTHGKKFGKNFDVIGKQ